MDLTVPPTPAEELLGNTLGDGWRVTKKLNPDPGATGGNFSTCYIVERNGHSAFLKAMDIYTALQRTGEAARALRHVSTAFTYECDLLDACAGKQMDRVVRAIDSGEYYVRPGDPASIVFFLVFELADGDIRTTHDIGVQLDLGRIYRALHDTAVGVQQLHTGDITHQDVKPSNVLVFTGPKREISRLADLGRASLPSADMEHDAHPFAGDPAHAPPEGLYGSAPPDWSGRRACDLYHLGSLLLFLFTGIGTTEAWLDRLDSALLPRYLGGTFSGSYSDVQPYIRDAMQRVCDDFPRFGDDRLREATVKIFRELCDPDPTLRGDPKMRMGHQDPYSVARYIALFDLEAQRSYMTIARKAHAA